MYRFQPSSVVETVFVGHPSYSAELQYFLIWSAVSENQRLYITIVSRPLLT